MTFLKKIDLNILDVSRYLIILMLIGLAISPALVNIFQAALFLIIIASSQIREMIYSSLSDNLVKSALLFFLIYLIYSFIGQGAFNFGTRKILMLIPAYALFKNAMEDKYIRLYCYFFIFLSIISIILFILNIQVGDRDVGIIAKNEVVQSLFIISAINLIIVNINIFFNKNKTLLYISLFLLIFNVIFISPAKSGYAGLIIVFSMYLFYLNEYKIDLKLFSKITIGILIIISTMMTLNRSNREIVNALDETINYSTREEKTSMGVRVIFLTETIGIIKKGFIIGHGTQSFEHVYTEHVKDNVGLRALVTSDPHNQYLKILVEQGILGLFAILLLILVAYFKKALKVYKYLAISMLSIWIFNSFFHSHFSTFPEGGFIFIWLGVMLSQLKNNNISDE